MFPVEWIRQHNELGFPRVRGDVPAGVERVAAQQAFSPRARGCSCSGATRHPHHQVFPACAGMFLLHQLVCMCTSGFPRVRGDVP